MTIITKDNYQDYTNEDGTILDCSNSGITEIQYLPEGLKRLECSYNQLTSLPELPKGLEECVVERQREGNIYLRKVYTFDKYIPNQ